MISSDEVNKMKDLKTPLHNVDRYIGVYFKSYAYGDVFLFSIQCTCLSKLSIVSLMKAGNIMKTPAHTLLGHLVHGNCLLPNKWIVYCQ